MPDAANLIIYDGECIYCQNYVAFLRLQEAIGPVELLDARSDDPRIARYWEQGYDLNEGMLFVHRGQVHHGADAISTLARLSREDDVRSRMNARLFSHHAAARRLYPLLKFGRRVTLMLRGRNAIQPPKSD